MPLRLKVNPENETEIWATFDGRDPTEDDHDFGADFYFYPAQEIDVANTIPLIVAATNAANLEV